MALHEATYYSDDTVTLFHGDALAVLREMPDQSVDCCVTSPPYFGLRDYGQEGQYGLEASPAEYVETMRALFAEVRRVLVDDGTMWLNLGDSYSSGSRMGCASKNLLGIPWRVAFALQDDGWILRNDIIWAKTNAMPESVRDRLSKKYEHMFMFTKSQRYWFDLDPIREEQSPVSIARATRADMRGKDGWADAYHGNPPTGLAQSKRNTTIGKNPGDVWNIATRHAPGAHFAVMPPELARRAVVAGCKPGGTVLDPFSGSGTTGLVAEQSGRKYVGIDISAEYLDLSLRTRLQREGKGETDGAT